LPEFVNTFISTSDLGAFVLSGGSIKVVPIKGQEGAKLKHSLVCTDIRGHVRILNDKNGDVKEYSISGIVDLLRRETTLRTVSICTEFGSDFIVTSGSVDWSEVGG